MSDTPKPTSNINTHYRLIVGISLFFISIGWSIYSGLLIDLISSPEEVSYWDLFPILGILIALILIKPLEPIDQSEGSKKDYLDQIPY